MSFAPFRDGETSSAFQSNIAKLTQETRGPANRYVLRASPKELEQFYLDKAHIGPLKLHVDDCHIDYERSVQVDAPRRDPNRVLFPGRQALSLPGTQLYHRDPR